MNILLISNSASFHYLSKIFSKDNIVSGVYHYGANSSLKLDTKYFPVHISLPYDKSIDFEVKTIVNDLKYQKIDLILGSGIPVPASQFLHSFIRENNIYNLLPNPYLLKLENDRLFTKNILSKLDIPHSRGIRISTWSLFRDFFKHPRPFVVKSNKTFKHGRQTLVVTDHNIDELFSLLFSKFINGTENLFSVKEDTELILEEYIEIKKEISYHILMNKETWKYIGSARDYKKENNGDRGFLVDSMGSYFVREVDTRIHDYAEKIFNYLKSKNFPYNGFLFLGIGIGTDNIPYVLEINTRPGDPEIATIAGSVSNFTEIVFSMSKNLKAPDIITKGETVAVSINNTDQDWTNIAVDPPNFKNIPNDIDYCLCGVKDFKSKHSLFVCTGNTKENAANKIFRYLETQDLGQFYYRSDIGLLE
jgi:phosphoribosylamine-glycine ligase